MKKWNQRPFEIRNLFNPAFCGLIIHRALSAYEERDARGMPFSLSLLVLPLCLHKDSREVIRDNNRSYLLRVAEHHQQLVVGFANRVTQMLPFTFEGYGLLSDHGCISVSNEGRITTIAKRVRKAVRGTVETVDCQKVARVIGLEFARIGDRATIFSTFGVRP